MKEKSAMEENFFDFAQTKEALSQLSADLAVLDSELQNRAASIIKEREAVRRTLSEKDTQIETLRSDILKATQSIDSITAYIDGVL